MVCKTAHRDISLFPVRVLDYPYHITSVFPSVVPIDQVTMQSRLSSNSSLNKPNGISLADSDTLERLLIVDYRYSRFALDPRTGLFAMIRLVIQDPAH